MSYSHLIVDGMLSGTGVRDAVKGGYIELIELNISNSLIEKISEWQKNYEEAHFFQFSDDLNNKILDDRGIEISKIIRQELPNVRIEYFSNANMKMII